MANSITFNKEALKSALVKLSQSYKLVDDKIKELNLNNEELKKYWRCSEGDKVIKQYEKINEYYKKMNQIYLIYYNYLNNSISTIYTNLESEINSAINAAIKGSES